MPWLFFFGTFQKDTYFLATDTYGTFTLFIILIMCSVSCVIIIIINFYGTYILKNLGSEAQQNIIIKHNREQGSAKVVRTRDNQRFMVKIQFGINVLSFFWKIAIVSD